MAWIQGRLDRLRQIVALSIKGGWDPTRIGFADFVLRSASDFGISPKTARTYVVTLVEAFRHNKWLSYVRYNHYLTEEEKQNWMKQHSQTS